MIVKYAYLRGMLKHEHGTHCVKEIVSVIKFELKTTTKNSCTFLLKSLECINSRDESPINSIMKLHSLVTHDDKVILLPWTSTNYIVNVICHECKGKKEFVKPSNVSLGNYNDSILKDKIELHDTDDEAQTDVESDGV